MKNKFLFACFIVFCFSLGFIGCGDKGTDPIDSNPVNNVETTISGIVTDENNTPVSGAMVSLAGESDITDANGVFLFSNIQVPKDRFVVNVTKSGYFKGSVSDKPKVNSTCNVRVCLLSSGITEVVDAGSGGEVITDNGTGVKLTPGTIVKEDGSNFTGDVNVSVGYLDPTSENFQDLVPGGDMSAQRTDNSEVTLYSYGIIKVEMKNDAGEELQIKSGNQSEITVAIPDEMQATAPSIIPLWHYDTKTGMWKEEGTATKQGDKYVGMVGHFSDWNCDVPEGTSTVHGLVVDCNNLPAPGIRVKIGQSSAVTDINGKFERRVPANTPFDVQVLGGTNFGISSIAVSVPSLSEGTNRNVGTIEVDCPSYVIGTLRCDGQVKTGQVTICWPGGHNSIFSDAQGKFRLAVDISKSAEFSVYTLDNRYKSMNITTPSARGDSLDLGIIEVCQEVELGDNKFTLNGGGYNNKTFSYNSDTTYVFGYYFPEDSMTYIFMQQIFVTDTIVFTIAFTGSNEGSGKDVFFTLWRNSDLFFAYEGFQGTSAFVNITKYSGIGGLMEGSFNGALMNFSMTPIAISNGKFSVVRIIGENNLDKIRKYKISNEIVQKIK